MRTLAIASTLLCAIIVLANPQNLSRLPSSSAHPGAELATGVVAGKPAAGGAAERAGIREGDLILTWSFQNEGGNIESPFDLTLLETEKAARGEVLLKGVRESQKQTWKLGPIRWGLETRANFGEQALSDYRRGLDLANTGKPAEAIKIWSGLEEKWGDSSPAWLEAWLLLQSAELLNAADQWPAAEPLYQQAIVKAREAGPTVLQRVLFVQATRLLEHDDYERAATQYRSALAEAQKINPDGLAVATCLYQLGQVALYRGDLTTAGTYFEQSVAIRNKFAPGSLQAAESLDRVGVVASRRSELNKAEEYMSQALAIREKLTPEGAGVASSLVNLGNVYRDRGDFDKAEASFQRALKIFQRGNPRGTGAAKALNNLGELANQRGDLKAAEEYLRQALAIKEKIAPDSMDLASSLENLGVVVERRGDLNGAEEYYRQSLAINERVAPDSLETAETFGNLGELAVAQGDLERAEQWLSRTLAIVEKQAPDSQDMALTLVNLGNIKGERGELEAANQLYLRGLVIQQRLAPHSADVVWTLSSLAGLALKRRETSVAEQYLNQARELTEKQGNNSLALALVLYQLGEVANKAGDLSNAEGYYRQSLKLHQSLAQTDTRAALALNLRKQGKLNESAEMFDQALDGIENQMSLFGGTPELRALFRGRQEEYYKQYIDLLVTRQDPERAFSVLERSRARTMLETLAVAHIDVRTGVDPVLLDKEHLLQQMFAEKTSRRVQLLNMDQTSAQVTALDKEIGEVEAEYRKVEREIQRTSPAYAALTQPQPLSAKAVQERLLDPDTLLLEYSLGEDQSYVFAVTPGSVTAHPLPKRSEIEGEARRVYNLLIARNRSPKGETETQKLRRLHRATADYRRAVADLSRMLLTPVAKQLRSKRLLVVSDGALEYISFALLSVPEEPLRSPTAQPLILTHEIIQLPSASVLALLRKQEEGKEQASGEVAVLADPVFDAQDPRVTSPPGEKKNAGHGISDAGTTDSPLSARLLTRAITDLAGEGRAGLGLPRLQFTEEEAKSILAVTPPGRGLLALGFDASRTTAISPDLQRYRIIHFATHGLLDSQHPELSGLVLSLVDKQGRPQNGFLSLQDIYNLTLPVDLVVLSACETGLGKEVHGEGLVGLTRAFMYAGASRVVSSLWKVSDAGTAILMQDFYRAMERDHLPPATALRTAQLHMLKQKRWHDPYYWAAFQVQGEWK